MNDYNPEKMLGIVIIYVAVMFAFISAAWYY